MGQSRFIALLAAGMLVGLSACDTGGRVQEATATEPAPRGDRRGDQSASKKMKVTIGSKTFTATLDDNPAAAKFKAMLPLTVDMTELNGNEKYYQLPVSLPVDAANPGTIQTGDLLLWQDDTLVLFYQTFKTTYRYTRLGRIDDPAGLTAALGPGAVKVAFELE